MQNEPDARIARAALTQPGDGGGAMITETTVVVLGSSRCARVCAGCARTSSVW